MSNGDSELSRLVDQLEREHAGEPWHGSSLVAILTGITHQQAAARPLPGAQTIWELVLHITAWKNEARQRLHGQPAGDPSEGDWPQPPAAASADAWRQALEALEEAHRALIDTITRLRDPQLFEQTNDSRTDESDSGNYFQLVQGILQHDAYHSGQIALLKKSVV